MASDEERATTRRWAKTADQAAELAGQAEYLLGSEPDYPAASAGALVSIAHSLSVIAQVVAVQLDEDIQR